MKAALPDNCGIRGESQRPVATQAGRFKTSQPREKNAFLQSRDCGLGCRMKRPLLARPFATLARRYCVGPRVIFYFSFSRFRRVRHRKPAEVLAFWQGDTFGRFVACVTLGWNWPRHPTRRLRAASASAKAWRDD